MGTMTIERAQHINGLVVLASFAGRGAGELDTDTVAELEALSLAEMVEACELAKTNRGKGMFVDPRGVAALYTAIHFSPGPDGQDLVIAWRGRALVVADLPPTCRVCGCTDEDCSGCIQRTGHPCSWVEDDLCSACVGGAS